ncbi:zinc finger protein [Cryptococcus deuterogattii 99/473]|uniref:Zinc finger protein n=2 Tax=Cryptococcus deuterogattii TaxID=1859096 RepID=A0A0D0V259_9TREE|nr:zinc finger protein [Cryptococcus deuterogattii R265]KIR33851.1 zinc finger protein [Cryptococcus deuterogattii MMRL2647]KIR40599.1 zinc finger protein [Cryptococcus deuterogattii Ram5]KIR74280.1 zinc finger protein [Cryptococcus deuterogattii CA1014]KIY55250.1 zinc finger protein [Cryptococcus deuterogattii 99/473]
MSSDKTNLFPTLGEVADRTGMTESAGLEQEGDDKQIQEVESLCMRCHENGTTRLLLTSIPYFKEIVVSSFRCDHCGHRDTEIQSAGEIQPKGVTYTVHLLTRADLDRQIVKSNWATITIPDIQLTIPPGRGQINTVEGVIRDTVRDLNISQPVRRVMDPETAKKIDELLEKLKAAIDMEEEDEDDGGVGIDDDEKPVHHESSNSSSKEEKPFVPFSMIVDDPSGNSYFQFKGSQSDPQWNMRAYNRTFDQNVTLGLVARPNDMSEEQPEGVPIVAADHKLSSVEEFESKRNKNMMDRDDGTVVPDEIYSFPATCSSCGHELETLMQQVNIPYFQNIIIMSSNCYACGYRDNEVKSGGSISPKGKRITLKVEDEEDLSRDMLKSDTAGLSIPEIDLVLQPGTLGGRFTTLEGLLNEIYTELSTKVFRSGDSSTAGIGQADSNVGEDEVNFGNFLKGLKECMSAQRKFTLILDDPVSNSYLQNLYAPDPDPNMQIEEYERTYEQNEELGLNGMVLEGYNEEAEGTA